MTLSAPFGQEFRFCNGNSAGNLRDFLYRVRELSKQEFCHHNERNDFANWVNNSLRERALAHNLRSKTTKHECVIEVSRFLASRKSKAGFFAVLQKL